MMTDSIFDRSKIRLSFFIGMMAVIAFAYFSLADGNYAYLDEAHRVVMSDLQDPLEKSDLSLPDDLLGILITRIMACVFIALVLAITFQIFGIRQSILLQQIRPRSPPAK
jgi:predicted PurR-regulated permease PerM